MMLGRGIAGLLPLMLLACAIPGAHPVARMEAITTPVPTRSSAVRAEIASALERGDRAAATRNIVAFARMGAALSPESQARLVPFLDPLHLPEDWRADVPGTIARMFAHNGRAQRAGYVVTAVPAEHRLVEAVAWDEAGES